MNVYRIYDDEVSLIYGPEQLRGFTICQTRDMLCVNSDEEITECVHRFMSKENHDLACKVLSDFRQDETVLDNVSEEFLIDLIKMIGFEIQKLDIH